MWGHANSAVQKTPMVFIVQGILFAFVTNEINADVSRVRGRNSAEQRCAFVRARVFKIELTFWE